MYFNYFTDGKTLINIIEIIVPILITLLVTKKVHTTRKT